MLADGVPSTATHLTVSFFDVDSGSIDAVEQHLSARRSASPILPVADPA